MDNLIINRHLALQIEFRKMSLHNQSDVIPVGKRVTEISSLCDKRPPPRSEDLPRLSQTDQLQSFTQPWEFTSHIFRALTSLIITPQLPLLSQDSVSHQVNNRKQGNQNRWLMPLQARRQLRAPLKIVVPMTHEFL